MKLNRKLLLIFFSIYCFSIGYSQIPNDTVIISEEIPENLDEEDADTTASDTINHGFTVFDLNTVPAAPIYNSWNNLLVNPYGIDLVNKPDTTFIDFSKFVFPLKSSRITSNFGWRRWQWHYGMDLKLQIGDTVFSPFDGMIRVAKRSRSFGNYIVVRHTNGLETIYGHLSKLLVVVNQPVKSGEPIGLGGNTGRSTGPHLHFEVRFLGNNLNPNDIIDFTNYRSVNDTLLLSRTHFNYITEIRKIRFHIIRRGDTLSGIAHRYGVSINKLCSLNRIRRTTLLRIGRRIRYT